MVEVVYLPPGPIPADLADRIGGRPAYVPTSLSVLAESLVAHGIPVTIADTVEVGVLLLADPGPLNDLARVVARLRGPGGCPWDQAQTLESLRKYLIEETYESVEAIDQGDMDALREELGDLLLQPALLAQIAAESGHFTLQDVAQGIVDKLIRRHPHVFGDVEVANADEVLKNWDAIKRSEREERPKSILSGVPASMPALAMALEVSKRAARAGFEWANVTDVFAKLDEERRELAAAIRDAEPKDIADELGDYLFTAVNVARWLKIDPEDALRTMVHRFRARFEYIESRSPTPLGDLSADEWDRLWNEAKLAGVQP